MEPGPKTILVSSCLLGLDTRYNGVCKKNQDVLDFLSTGNWTVIPVCPEQLAGLPTPRPATCFEQGDGMQVLDGTGSVINSNGENMNSPFIKGAGQSLEIAELNRCRLALMKERSPSCGVHQVYRGKKRVAGSGVTTALFKRAGINVFSEDELNEVVVSCNQEK